MRPGSPGNVSRICQTKMLGVFDPEPRGLLGINHHCGTRRAQHGSSAEPGCPWRRTLLPSSQLANTAQAQGAALMAIRDQDSQVPPKPPDGGRMMATDSCGTQEPQPRAA